MQGPNTGTTSEQKSGPTGQAGPAETRLVLDVPPGLAVTVDGELRGRRRRSRSSSRRASTRSSSTARAGRRAPRWRPPPPRSPP
ncbi:hypothetical protein [Nannocystis pusilla]|uniref:hypothetical protein n=1 Tax=Nannocystis pusilla TaxID=889268 RepID=UPI003B76B65E